MRFSLCGEELVITLDMRDTERLGVSFRAFDYQNETCRRVLDELIVAASRETGFHLNKEARRSIHLYEHRDGGVSFYIRALSKTEDACVYRFSGFDALCLARDAGVFEGKNVRLYREGKLFYLYSEQEEDVCLEYAALFCKARAAKLFCEGRKPCNTDWLTRRDQC